jgi:hypothetical protein
MQLDGATSNDRHLPEPWVHLPQVGGRPVEQLEIVGINVS